MKGKYCVLMTACISPEAGIEKKPGNRLKRFDPGLRLKDYASGLRFWLDYPDDRIESIVFADNSGFDLAELEKLVNVAGTNKKVEFLSLPICQWPEHVHYGYCELQIMDEALAKSVCLKEADYILKATGRLRFTGVKELMDCLPEDLLFAVDCSRLKLPLRAERRGLMTQLMLFNKEFYIRHLEGVKVKLQPWVLSHIEDLLFFELIKLKGVKGAVLRFPVNVACIGVSATTNMSYMSFPVRAKSLLRSIMRRLAPGIWI